MDITTALQQPVELDLPQGTYATPNAGPGVLIVHVNSPLVPMAIWQLGRSFIRDKYVVGYWAWELEAVPSDWKFGIDFVHEIWVPSTFVAEAVRPIAKGKPVRVVPHPVALGRSKEELPSNTERRDCFTVTCMFNAASSVGRKNPYAVLEAFRLAFGDSQDVRLLIKTSNFDERYPGHEDFKQRVAETDNVELINATWSEQQIEDLYAKTDVLISLHRSEGFGLVLAEAMLRGIPVIATDWSGNRDFLTEETGCPVPFTLTPALDPQGIYDHASLHWADADVNSAAEYLKKLRADVGLRESLGRAGQDFAFENWGPDHYSQIVAEALGLQP
ncbi:MAG: glycosyltransferase [Filomicrobium sp.]